ncbi:hypothetical protein CDAR_26501 [Caerostris darwini]|uniref:Uncharacterized protein n=1 Tax=Caerostris darwini TaxID=1538125 RepID=A0AAV4QCA8_9ARAC|nr:hypothetical protein CDAR_26501 [Caerostris darwini]
MREQLFPEFSIRGTAPAVTTLPARWGEVEPVLVRRESPQIGQLGVKRLTNGKRVRAPLGRAFGPGQVAGLSSRAVSSKIPNELYKS